MNVSSSVRTVASAPNHLTPSSFGAPGYPGAPSLGLPRPTSAPAPAPAPATHLTPSSFGAPGYPGAPSLGAGRR